MNIANPVLFEDNFVIVTQDTDEGNGTMEYKAKIKYPYGEEEFFKKSREIRLLMGKARLLEVEDLLVNTESEVAATGNDNAPPEEMPYNFYFQAIVEAQFDFAIKIIEAHFNLVFDEKVYHFLIESGEIDDLDSCILMIRTGMVFRAMLGEKINYKSIA